MKTHFPTRQTISRGLGREALEQLRTRSITENIVLVANLPGTNEIPVESPLHRFVLGIDPAVALMPLAEVESLGDAFTQSLLLRGTNPKTVRQLLDAIAALPPADGFPVRQLFLIAEGAQPRRQVPDFELNARLVFVWRKDDQSKPDMFLSTVPSADDPQALMQLIAWSAKDSAFHYFERERVSGQWVWAGNSFNALDERSRGKGPFDSHINGSLVMKELKAPWSHWHSISASIPRNVFPHGSPLLTETQFQDIESADKLETIVRAGIRRWTTSRFDQRTNNAILTDCKAFFRQVLWCTSVNLASSPSIIGNPQMGAFNLPISFFFDFDAIEILADALGTALLPSGLLRVNEADYRGALETISLEISDDGPPPPKTVRGDTHFAFLVPERAAEDQEVLSQLVSREALHPRTALCLVFVDFSNPVFSPDRAMLLDYVPAQVLLGSAGADFDQQFIAAVRAASKPPDSPEGQFLALVDHPDLLAHVTGALAEYHDALARLLATPAGVQDVVELAASRRQAFAKKRKLREFNSTLALTGLVKPHLAMRPDGSIFTKGTDIGEDEL